jgi:hypothetical protein
MEEGQRTHLFLFFFFAPPMAAPCFQGHFVFASAE